LEVNSPRPKPDNLPKAVDVAYRGIRDAIMKGELKAGESLPEADLALRVNVSRTPIREALARLRDEGLVVMESYRQHCVARFDEKDVMELFELRGLLEGHAAGRAATRISEDQLARLKTLNDEMLALLSPLTDTARGEFENLNEEFHQIIRTAADTSRIERLLARSVDVPFNALRRVEEQVPNSIQRAVAFHNEIIAALEGRHAERARIQMSAHILSLINVERF